MAQDQSGYLLNRLKESYSEIFFSLVNILFRSVFFNKFSRIQKIFFRFWFSIRSQLTFGDSKVWEDNKNRGSELSNKQRYFDKRRDDTSLRVEEVEMVMGKLGLFCSPESEKLNEIVGANGFLHLFDEKEPSIDEIKEAFDVFDENGDGFIDAVELQRVLHCLGLKEGIELEICRKMITTCDEDKDGRIDFNEFVKFMENMFS